MQLLGPRLPGSEEDVVRESLEYVSLGFLAFSSVAVLLGVRTPAALTLLVLAAALVACLAVAPSLLPQPAQVLALCVSIAGLFVVINLAAQGPDKADDTRQQEQQEEGQEQGQEARQGGQLQRQPRKSPARATAPAQPAESYQGLQELSSGSSGGPSFSSQGDAAAAARGGAAAMDAAHTRVTDSGSSEQGAGVVQGVLHPGAATGNQYQQQHHRHRSPSGTRQGATPLAWRLGADAVEEDAQASAWTLLPEAVMAQVVQLVGPHGARAMRAVSRDWRLSASRAITCLAPADLQLDKLAAAFPLLHELDLSGCMQEVRPSKLRSLTKLPALSHLALGSTGQAGQGCSAKAAGTGGGGVAAAVSNRCLLALPQCLAKGGTGLKSLSLAQCVHISDEGLMAISALSGLTALNLAGCVAVSDVGVMLLAQLPQLAALEIPWCLKVTNAGLKALGPAGRSLTELNVTGCALVSEAGVAALACLTRLSKLAALNLGAARPAVTDASLARLSTLTQLTSLAIGGMTPGGTGVTDVGLAALPGHHPHLASLSLAYLDGVGDAGLAAVASGLPSLTALHVRGCGRVTQAALPLLAALTRLTDLDLLNCHMMPLGPQGVASLLGIRQGPLQPPPQLQGLGAAAAAAAAAGAAGAPGAPGAAGGVWAAAVGSTGAGTSSTAAAGAAGAGASGSGGPAGSGPTQGPVVQGSPSTSGGGPAGPATFMLGPSFPAGLPGASGAASADLGGGGGGGGIAGASTSSGISSPGGSRLSRSGGSGSYNGANGGLSTAGLLGAALSLPSAPAAPLVSLGLGSSSPHLGARQTPEDACLELVAAVGLGRTLRSLSLASFAGTLAVPHALAALSGLTCLELLQGAPRVTDAGLATLCASPCAELLQALALVRLGPGVSAGGLGPLVRCTSLSSLNLGHCGHAVTDTVMDMLADGLTGLQSLSLEGAGELTDAGLASLARLTSLRSLNLSFCGLITGIGFTAWAAWASGHALHPAGPAEGAGTGRGLAWDAAGAQLLPPGPPSAFATTPEQAAMAQGSLRGAAGGGTRSAGGGGGSGGSSRRRGPKHRLTTLNVGCCNALGDPGLAALAATCTSLTRLDLPQAAAVTDAGIAHLATLKHLTALDLAHCSRISDMSLAALGGLPHLATLKVNGCVRLSDAGLAALPRLAGALLTLHLDKCVKVTDAGVAHVAQVTSLTSLRLARCPEITDVGVAALSQLSRLATLSLAHCAEVTSQGLMALAPLTALASLEF